MGCGGGVGGGSAIDRNQTLCLIVMHAPISPTSYK